jgi:hypothetical protein
MKVDKYQFCRLNLVHIPSRLLLFQTHSNETIDMHHANQAATVTNLAALTDIQLLDNYVHMYNHNYRNKVTRILQTRLILQ